MSPTARRATEVAVMLLAAILEVGGDAMIRGGLRGGAWALCALGAGTLAAYGILVNLLPMDFSKLLATYVGLFAIVSVLLGRTLFKEQIASSTWIGLAVILAGSAIVQFGATPR